MTPEQRLALAVKDLAEHFDVVQVFVQLHDSDSDKTDTWTDGRGNNLARKAHVEHWLDDFGTEYGDEELTT